MAEIADPGDAFRVGLPAPGTACHIPKTPAHRRIFSHPHIAAVLTSNDGTACKVAVAILTNVNDKFSIADAELQRHEAVVALGADVAESTDITAHRTCPACCVLLRKNFKSLSLPSYHRG